MKASMGGIDPSHLNGSIDHLCTPCHDPHGVSPTLGANQAYAVPLLKGTWLTSPYKEDHPAPNPSGPTTTAKSWGVYQSHIKNPAGPPTPVTKYNLDRTTFGGTTRISEDATKFAGLCLSCHPKANLTTATTASPDKTKPFKSLERVHQTVKGWGANTEHSYSCSKCHTPHASGLPRLMQTNCLQYTHRGNVSSLGSFWNSLAQTPVSRSPGNGVPELRGYPIGNVLGNGAELASTTTTNCHGGAQTNPGTYPDTNLWNNVTPWQ